MRQKLKDKILKIYPEYTTIYGPYKRSSDDRSIVILYDGKKRTARLYAKVKLEVKLGRRLKKTETVDHIDEDTTNDNYSNLQPLKRGDNIRKNIRGRVPIITSKCPYCDKEIFYTKGSKWGKLKFCNNSCRSKFYGANQWGDKLKGYKKK